eukprot:Nitzschia sp. Nitz4//scaffold13_size275219//229109//230596//NITZ4_000915-RA/size275219-processed-gene-0.110-mRNA-1//1//CDS//3329536137//3109//frame0
MSGSSRICSQPTKHVVIVGGGIAGMTCARELLERTMTVKNEHKTRIHITLVEAMDRLGGRIRSADSTKFPTLQAGAEYLHGYGHMLWDWIKDFQEKGLLPKEGEGEEDLLEPHFILSHADGGPDDEPTPQGHMGMYYMDGELLPYDSDRTKPLTEVLEAIFEATDEYPDNISLADALEQQQEYPLSEGLRQLCIASYGNTAGCCNLADLSVRQLLAFEHHWETKEIEGDFRPLFGMDRVIGAIQHILDQEGYKERLTIRLETPVRQIHEESRGQVQVQLESEETLVADAVVVTVPPTRLPQLFSDFPRAKQDALEYIGFCRVAKVVCGFRRPLWPAKVQSVVAERQPVPELWFRESNGVHLVFGYLASIAADDFYEQLEQDSSGGQVTMEQAAENIMVKQLATVFSLSEKEVREVLLNDCTLVYDWKVEHPYIQGGYMYPKVGIRPFDLENLAAPMGNIYFAGEATNTDACCTIQAAMETAVRAAGEAMVSLEKE